MMVWNMRIYRTAGLLVLLLLLSLNGAVGAAFPLTPVAPVTAPAAGVAPLTHGRLSQLSWTAVSANTAILHAVAGLRRSYFQPPPNLGDSISYTPIVFGDGFQSPNNLFIVTYVDAVRDWFIAEKDATHTYSGPGPWTANFNTCCRLSPPQHRNNPDQAYRAETLVNFAGTSASPVSNLPAIVDCPQESICNFAVPAFDPDGQQIYFRFATAAEAGAAAFHQPGPPEAPNAATINATTGVYTWDTHGATLNTGGDTLYSTQIMIENLDCGVVVAKTPLDFFIRLIPISNNPPRFIPPTPPDGTIYTIMAGTTLTVPVAADDPDLTDNVSLAVLNLPTGAGFPIPPPANPVSSLLTWTPGASQVGPHVINFVATDTPGAQAFTSIVVNVTSLDRPVVPAGSCLTPTPSSPSPTVSITPTASPPPVPPTTTPCALTFSDVDASNPFYPFIRCLACRQVVSGYADGTFRWGNAVTRGQLAKILMAGSTISIPSTQQTFSDVPNSNPFWFYIELLSMVGAASGYNCGGSGEPCDPLNRPYFRWGNPATRGQIAKITAVTAGWNGPVPTTRQTFADVPVSNPFWLWIEELAARTIISGYGCGGPGEPCDPLNRPYFRWGLDATRGQMSKIAANAFYPSCQTPQARR
jgi:hypothetical protein